MPVSSLRWEESLSRLGRFKCFARLELASESQNLPQQRARSPNRTFVSGLELFELKCIFWIVQWYKHVSWRLESTIGLHTVVNRKCCHDCREWWNYWRGHCGGSFVEKSLIVYASLDSSASPWSSTSSNRKRSWTSSDRKRSAWEDPLLLKEWCQMSMLWRSYRDECYLIRRMRSGVSSVCQ